MTLPRRQYPTLSQRCQELLRLNIPGMRFDNRSGREPWCFFTIAPSEFSRFYDCSMRLRRGFYSPQVFVHAPDLNILAGGRRVPHTYRHVGKETQLCLCLPDGADWDPRMPLSETYVPWTVEWLWHFEGWLATDVWSGGGKLHNGQQNE